MNTHPEIAGMIVARQYREMLATAERARMIGDAGRHTPRRRRALIMLALARSTGREPFSTQPAPPPLPAA